MWHYNVNALTYSIFQWYEIKLFKVADPGKSFLDTLKEANFPDPILLELKSKVKSSPEGGNPEGTGQQQEEEPPKVMVGGQVYSWWSPRRKSLSQADQPLADADYEAGLKYLWRGGLARLRQLVRAGHIEENHLQRMASPSQMDVKLVFNKYHFSHPANFTLEEMLARWYNNKLFELTPERAQSVLIEVLRDSAVADVHISLVKKDFAK